MRPWSTFTAARKRPRCWRAPQPLRIDTCSRHWLCGRPIHASHATAPCSAHPSHQLRSTNAYVRPLCFLALAKCTCVQAETGRTVVTVQTQQGERFTAHRVIVTVPATLCSRIQFSPPLPALRDQLGMRMPMGCVIKCIIRFDRPFWRERGYSGEIVSDGPLCVCYDKYFRARHLRHRGADLRVRLADMCSGLPVADTVFACLFYICLCAGRRRVCGPRGRARAAGCRAAAAGQSIWHGRGAAVQAVRGKVCLFVCLFVCFFLFLFVVCNPCMQDWTQEEWSRGCYMSVFAPGAIEVCPFSNLLAVLAIDQLCVSL